MRASLLPSVASLIFSAMLIFMMRWVRFSRLPSSMGGAPSSCTSWKSWSTCSAVGPGSGGACTACGPNRRTRAACICGTSASVSPLRTAKSHTESISAWLALGLVHSLRMMSSCRSRRSWFWPMISASFALHPATTSATASSGVVALRTSISA